MKKILPVIFTCGALIGSIVYYNTTKDYTKEESICINDDFIEFYELIMNDSNLSEEEKWEIDVKGNKWKQFHTSYGHHSKGYIRKGELMDYYNDDTIKICNEYFLADFENFGYQMIEI